MTSNRIVVTMVAIKITKCNGNDNNQALFSHFSPQATRRNKYRLLRQDVKTSRIPGEFQF